MASTFERSTPTKVWVENGGGGTAGLQPRMVPPSVANRKRDGPEWVPSLITNRGPPLKTRPVGFPGTWTTSGIGFPSPPYSVDTSVSLSATHHGVFGPAARPHALTRFGS